MNPTVLAAVTSGLVGEVERAAREFGAGVHHTGPEDVISDLESARPDAVIIDLRLPEALGLLVGVRSFAPEVPIIVLAAGLGAAETDELVRSRVSSVLVQPVGAEAIAAVLGPLLPRAAPRRPHILAVDDDDLCLRILRMRLDAAGYEVTTARGGELGLAAAIDRRPDLIVCDLLMPDLDGFAFTQRVRREPAIASTPVILLTLTYDDDASRRLGFDCGAQAYLERTTTLEELLAEIKVQLATGPRPRGVPDPAALDERLEAWHRVQSDRLIRTNVALTRNSILSEAAIRILGSTTAAIAAGGDLRDIHGKVLQICVDDGALSLAALYLRRPGNTLEVVGAAGASFIAHPELPAAETVEELLAAWPEAPVVAIPGSMVDVDPIRRFLGEVKAGSTLIARLRAGGHDLGVLILGSDRNDISSTDWRTFASTVSTQLALTLLLLGVAQNTRS